MLDFSNQLTTATANLDDLRQVNLMLTNDLATSRQAVLSLSNSFNETSNALNDTKSLLQNAQSQITNLNDHITDLQAQNQALDERANSLSNNLAQLERANRRNAGKTRPLRDQQRVSDRAIERANGAKGRTGTQVQ